MKTSSHSFDIHAGNYHSIRPGYPSALFQDLAEQTGLNRNSTMLEIGAGSGIATKELAEWAGHITAIEPGANLASILKEEAKNYQNIEVVQDSFENFHSKDKFDIITAFTAFHWIDNQVKFQKTNDLLTQEGTLAIAWNSFLQSDSPVAAKVNGILHRLLPEKYPENLKAREVNDKVLTKLSEREQEILQDSLFIPIFSKKYLTYYNYDAETYPQLLNTFPDIIEAEEQKKRQLFQEIVEVIKNHGKIVLPVLSTIIICKKRENFLRLK